MATSKTSLRRSAFCVAGLCLAAIAGQAHAIVQPVRMGSASNALSTVDPAQSQVTASDALGTVVFIHQQDVSVWGGGGNDSGKLRYDISFDGGATFAADVGPLNEVYTRPARHPNVVLTNLGGSANPFDARLVWSASVLDPSPSPDGHVAGVSSVVGAGVPVSTENYLFIAEPATRPGGLTTGLPGEFWSCGLTNVTLEAPGDLRLYRGVLSPDTGDVVWREHLVVPAVLGPNDNRSLAAPGIAFSPNGRIGWFAYVGGPSAGGDEGRRPFLGRSGDGGSTWSTPVEVELENLPLTGPHPTLGAWLAATLGDPQDGPALPTTTYESDLTVDDRGHPHLLIGVGRAQRGQSLNLDARPGHLLIDLTTDDGGASWRALRVADLNAHESSVGGASGSEPLTVGNSPQIARTEDGTRVFFSWTDSDLALVGPTNGLNLNPDLFIAGLRTSDEALIPPRNLTGDDLIYSGSVLFPTLAPTVLSGAGTYRLPIVVTEFQIPNDERMPVTFQYLGNDAVIEEAAFGGAEPPPPPPARWGRGAARRRGPGAEARRRRRAGSRRARCHRSLAR